MRCQSVRFQMIAFTNASSQHGSLIDIGCRFPFTGIIPPFLLHKTALFDKIYWYILRYKSPECLLACVFEGRRDLESEREKVHLHGNSPAILSSLICVPSSANIETRANIRVRWHFLRSSPPDTRHHIGTDSRWRIEKVLVISKCICIQNSASPALTIWNCFRLL